LPKEPQRVSRPFAASGRQAVGKHDGVDSPGAARGDAFEGQALILKQAIEYAPSERSVGAATLERQVDDPLPGRAGFLIHEAHCGG